MSKFLTTLVLAIIVFGALAVALVAGQTALIQAQASLSQANANTAQASANLVTQCLTGFLVLAALVAGGALGFGFAKLRQHWSTPAKKQGAWLPGPGARWQRRKAPAVTNLPTRTPVPPQLLPGYYPPPAYNAPPQPETYVLVEDDEDTGDEWLETWWQ